MRDLILFSNFFADAKQTSSIIGDMEFKDSQYGQEIPDFYMLSEEHQKFFQTVTNEPVIISPDQKSGVFRKPYTTIHFEDFVRKSAWVCAVALENNTFSILRNKEKDTTTVFNLEQDVQEFINTNCFDESKWDVEINIKLQSNQLILFKPWMWHKFETPSLMQFFYLTYDVADENVQEETNGDELQDSAE